MGRNIRWALEDKKKILLTATPLQNSLFELYGLSTIIDKHIFGDIKAFRANYVNEGNLDDLKVRLQGFTKRALRSQVSEYIRYTKRLPITQKFKATNEEQELYDAISSFLQREDTYAIPRNQRILTTLILRKLLASSTRAVEQTLETIKQRLINIKEGIIKEYNIDDFVDEDQKDIEEQSYDETIEEDYEEDSEEYYENMDLEKINEEIKEIEKFISMAKDIHTDTKSKALLKALKIGFKKMSELGAQKKALIFTESRRTQDYLKNFLEANGYKGKIVIFNGSNSGPEAKKIYEQWYEKNRNTGRISGSVIADKRAALIEHFRDYGEIMLATESAAEGVNLQFCSLVVNYDLPWNPQRIEQRIGRCHRYGQQFDVVVINFLNERNEADCRVYQLLEEKFNLFEGVFGSSDEVLGSIESGVDFEKKILNIYQSCRTKKEIEKAFKRLQNEMEEKIQTKMDKAKKVLLDNFDEDVHQRLKINYEKAKNHLDQYGKMFWSVSKYALYHYADFNENELSFNFKKPYKDYNRFGKYYLISKARKNVEGEYLYRLSHPLGEQVMEDILKMPISSAKVSFDITNHPVKISVIENLKSESGYLILTKLTIQSFEKEEHLLFSGFTKKGKYIDQEICEKMFRCNGEVMHSIQVPKDIKNKLLQESKRYCEATVNRVMEQNNNFFREEQERLEKWADDIILASEKELENIKSHISDLSRQARLATTTAEQHQLQLEISSLEKQKKHKRRKIFEVEDEILEKRDELIKKLEKRMHQSIYKEHLFIIKWEII